MWLVQLDPELLGALVDVLPVDAGGEGRLLQLLLDRLRLERRDPVGPDEAARVDEAGELVAGEERLLQRRVPRQAEVRGVRETPRRPRPASPPRAGSAHRPVGACRAWGAARSRSRAAARSPARAPRPRRTAARRRRRRPRPRARGAAAPRSSCSGSGSPRPGFTGRFQGGATIAARRGPDRRHAMRSPRPS